MALVDQYDIISELRAALSGRVITPDDAGYDAARTVFYGGIDRLNQNIPPAIGDPQQ